jgi:hypothetical protein
MNRLKLFFLLRKQNSLSLRRSPAFEQSVVAKVMMLFGLGVMTCYFIMIGTFMAIPASESRVFGLLLTLTPIWLTIDFFMRFMVQQTPSVVAKPYILQPVSLGSVIDTYLVNSMLTGYNLTWLALYLPYAFVVYCGGASFFMALSIVVSGLLLIMANSQIYLIVRTLVGRSILWSILPVILFGAFWISLAIDEDLFEDQMDFVADVCETWWFPLLCLTFLAVVFTINRWLQKRYVGEEIRRQEKKEGALKHVTQFSFLSNWGITGEYLKLELKSMMRNKTVRSRFISTITLIVVLTLLISFTSVYDNKMWLNYWCLYCFGLYGLTSLSKVMCPEGNYIDLLMTHKENILSLLRAKYYIHVAILFVPLILTLPAIVTGKFSILMVLAYMLLCSGLVYFMMFQLAVYNKQTLPLNNKLTGRGNMENGIQLVIELVAMFSPVVLVTIFILLFNETIAYAVLAVIGLLFTLAHPLWLRNIYNRMMVRKYENMEGFHATRSS